LAACGLAGWLLRIGSCRMALCHAWLFIKSRIRDFPKIGRGAVRELN